MKRKRPPKESVRLVGYDPEGKQVLEQLIPTADYYEQSHPVLDERNYRKACRIVRVRGTLYDAAGFAWQEFEAHYDATGAFLRDVAVSRGETDLEGQETLR